MEMFAILGALIGTIIALLTWDWADGHDKPWDLTKKK
jgi:hypothetical protein